MLHPFLPAGRLCHIQTFFTFSLTVRKRNYQVIWTELCTMEAEREPPGNLCSAHSAFPMILRRLELWKGQPLESTWSIKGTKVCNNCQGVRPKALGGLNWNSCDAGHERSTQCLAREVQDPAPYILLALLSTCLTSIIKRSDSEIEQMELGFMTLF